MNPITNVYILADTSFKMQKYSAKLQTALTRYARMLDLQNKKVKLHIIGYNDKAKILSPYGKVQSRGNPNLGKGLEYLEHILRYERKYGNRQTKSVFLLYSSETVLQGWNSPLQRLFRYKEFAFGLRYVIAYGNTDKYAQNAFTSFTDSPEKILRHFSEKRLAGLVKTCSLPMNRKKIQKKQKNY